MEVAIVILLDIAVASLVGLYAHQKRFSFWGYFFFSFFGTPFIALITLHVARQNAKRRATSRTTGEDLDSKGLDSTHSEKSSSQLNSHATPESVPTNQDTIETEIRLLNQLVELRDRHAITEDEFERKKNQLLGGQSK